MSSLFGGLVSANTFALTSTFGILITYTPYGGAPITLRAIVQRFPPEKTGETPRQQVSAVELFISKTDYPSTPLKDGDTVTLPDVPRPLTVVSILNEHLPGFWHLRVN